MVKVRLHDKSFLHAKCWLFYSDRPGQQMLFDRFRPILAIVGSSNFTAPGLSSNRELNLTHKVLIDPEEVEDPDAARAVEWLSDARPSERITAGNRQLLKSEVGARAIIDLETWYEQNWDDSRDFKQDLIDLLDASKLLRVKTFPSAQEFLARTAVEVPSCLVLDVELPGLSGLDLQQELAKADAQIPIIFLTGHGNVSMSVRAMKAGALEFFTKPIDDEVLLDAIQKGIAHYQIPRDQRRGTLRSLAKIDSSHIANAIAYPRIAGTGMKEFPSVELCS